MRPSRRLFILTPLFILYCSLAVAALKTGDWKTCSQSAFCRRGRALSGRAKEAGANWKSAYSIEPSSVVVASNEAALSATVKSSIYPDIKFKLDLQVLEDGVVRVRMDEVEGLRKRYNEASSWALISEPSVSKKFEWTVGKSDVRAVYGAKKDISVVVNFNPLKITLLRGGKEEIVMNGDGLLHMEYFRNKAEPPPAPTEVPEEGLDGDEEVQQVMEVNTAASWFEGEPDGWWEETFLSWTDKKPKGAFLILYCTNFAYAKEQVQSRCRSTSTSLAMDMCTVFLNARRAFLCQLRQAMMLSSMSHTGYSTPMFF